MRALFFPAPYADIQLLCSLCDSKRGHTLILRAPNTTTRFSSRSSNFCNFTPRLLQKQSQKVKHSKISWEGMPPDPPSRHATHALIAYWNPPFQNSRSATDLDRTVATVILTGVVCNFFCGAYCRYFCGSLLCYILALGGAYWL